MIYSPNYDNGNFALAVRDRYVYTKAYAVFVCRFIYFSGVNYSKKAEMTKLAKCISMAIQVKYIFMNLDVNNQMPQDRRKLIQIRLKHP